MDSGASSKRVRTSSDAADRDDDAPAVLGSREQPIVLESLLRPVSPPRKRSRPDLASEANEGSEAIGTSASTGGPLRSPFQLTAVTDLPASANVDTLTVRDVFGSPRLRACWEFNYLHDLDFLMGAAFDPDAVARGLEVHVVHGFGKRMDPRRDELEKDAKRINRSYAANAVNTTITTHTADLPQSFGTHHTKMAVLFHDDDTAQIVIYTANMIPHDWANMTQAVWRSPMLAQGPPLPRRRGMVRVGVRVDKTQLSVGDRFKNDFLNYLRAYNRRKPVCRPLVEQLLRYDFSAIKAVLVGSVPGQYAVRPPGEMDTVVDEKTGALPTQWGWDGLSRALQQVPIRTPAEVVVQMSSMATLGGSDAWIQQTLFRALSVGTPVREGEKPPAKPQFRVVFPVADEIRRSLDGYASGTSIHTKIQSPQQQQQLEYMRPLLCHWANDVPDGEPLPDSSAVPRRDSGRNRAAPHIKTYIRFVSDDGSSSSSNSIDWALLTSANLSKQAWGEAKSMSNEVRIASYELGVLVWPELLAGIGATMQPVFARDTLEDAADAADAADAPDARPVVPLRMPYSLPLQRYSKTERPWVVSLPHITPDWRGAIWTDPWR